MNEFHNLKWMEMYEIARDFYLSHGHLIVSKKDNLKLFNWVRTQRLAYKNRYIPEELRTNNFLPLTDERVTLLENIGMNFEPSKNSDEIFWMKMYELVKQYFLKNGTLSEIDDNDILRRWLAIQKLAYKNRSIPLNMRKNDYLPLSDEKVKLLEDIGFVFETQNSGLSRLWLEMYDEACKYYNEFGNLIVSTNYKTSSGKKLGFWIYHQRQAYKNRNISEKLRTNNFLPLTDEQVYLLEKIGMVWDANNQKCRWNLSFEMAKKFYIEHGDLVVPKSLKTVYGKSLLQWIKEQQKAVDYDKLSEDKVLKLSEIGICKKKKLNEYNWDDCFVLASKFYKENGHLNIPKNLILNGDIKLGLWLDRQIRIYRKEFNFDECDRTLSLDRIRLLESIGIEWNRKKNVEEVWNDNYKIAVEFYESHHHLNPSQYSSISKEVALFRWLKRQKKAYMNRFIPEKYRNFKFKPLTNEQVILLEKIGIVWEDKSFCFNEEWFCNFDLVKSMYDKGCLNSSFTVKTPDGIRINRWFCEQRLFYKQGLLTDEQINLLESVGMIWDLNEYYFVTHSLDASFKVKLEKRFLEFLSVYVKNNKNSIDCYEDVLNIVDCFFDSIGSSDNHYRKKL